MTIYNVKGNGSDGHSGRAFYQNHVLTWCGSEGNLAMKPVDMEKVTAFRAQTDDDVNSMIRGLVRLPSYW